MAGGVTGGAAGTWSDRFEQGLHPFIEVFNASIRFDLTLLPVSYTHLTLPTNDLG